MLLICSARHATLQSKGVTFASRLSETDRNARTLEALAEEFGLKKRIEFTGSVSNASISNVLSEAVAVVMPSTWEEVAGLVALEQMMQGRLVIAADIGGLGETVDGFGLKFPPGDITALKLCMRQTLENASLSTQMGKRAQINAIRMFCKSVPQRVICRYINKLCNPGPGPEGTMPMIDHPEFCVISRSCGHHTP